MFSGMKWLTTRGYMPSLYDVCIVHVDVAAAAAAAFQVYEFPVSTDAQ